MYDRNNIIVNAILLWQPDQNPHSFGYPGANASIGAYHGGTLSQRKELNVFQQQFIFLVNDMAEVIMHMDILQAGQLEMKLMQILRGITQVTSLRRIMHTFIPI